LFLSWFADARKIKDVSRDSGDESSSSPEEVAKNYATRSSTQQAVKLTSSKKIPVVLLERCG
jgi:hypothetical protein